MAKLNKMNWTALTQPLYRRTSPLRAPLCITPLHLSDNLPYPSHTLLPDPKTPTPPLLSLQSECHQYGYLGSLFIPPTAVSKKLSSFTHDMGHKPIVQLQCSKLMVVHSSKTSKKFRKRVVFFPTCPLGE